MQLWACLHIGIIPLFLESGRIQFIPELHPLLIFWATMIDIVRYFSFFSVDQERTSFEVFPAGLAIVEHDGTVKWLMPVILQSLCRIKVENYPFDVQVSIVLFSSILACTLLGSTHTHSNILIISQIKVSVSAWLYFRGFTVTNQLRNNYYAEFFHFAGLPIKVWILESGWFQVGYNKSYK